eukprot:9418512-Alexandrium_andersonii.AAC.1
MCIRDRGLAGWSSEPTPRSFLNRAVQVSNRLGPFGHSCERALGAGRAEVSRDAEGASVHEVSPARAKRPSWD